MSIEVNQLTKQYGSQKAIDGISFSALPGSIVGLLGSNGAGKSTTMRILAGAVTPTSGRALVAGFDAGKSNMELKRRLGYLPENNPLYLEMYIKEALDFHAGIYQITNRKKRIEEVISLAGLEKEQHKKIRQLSRGFRQRVGLAQTILHDPDIIILDEPTSGLDPHQLIEIRGLIRELGKTKTILLSTHILQEAEAICNKVVILDKGKIIADGELTSLFLENQVKNLEQLYVFLISGE